MMATLDTSFGEYRIRRNPNGIESYVWIHKTAHVADSVYVFDFARIGPGAIVTGDTTISGFARILADAQVFNSYVGVASEVSDRAMVIGSIVNDNAHVGHDAQLFQTEVGYRSTIGQRTTAVNYTIAEDTDILPDSSLRPLPNPSLLARLSMAVERLRF